MKNEIRYAHGGNVFKNKETNVTYFVEQRPDGVWTIYSEGPQWSRREEYVYGFASESDAIDIAKLEAGITHEEDPEAYFFRRTEFATGGGVKSNQYEVELESIDNPDFEYKKRYTKKIKKYRVTVNSIEEAKKVVSEFINDNDLGGGNFIGAQIYQNNKPIAYISYNLRVWAGKVGDMNSIPYEENNMDIQNKIDKLKKVYNSTLVPESVKAKALEEIEKLKKEKVNQTKTSAKEVKSEVSEILQKVFEIIEKNKINDANSLEEIVSEVLQDSNYHTEAFTFAFILDKSIVTKQDWYNSKRFVGDEKTRKIALEISQMTGWDASLFAPSLEFVLKMKGFDEIADALKKSFKEDESEYPNAIEELTKRQTEYTQEIANRTGLRQGAIAEFVAKNGLTELETLNLLQGLGMGKLNPRDLQTAILGVANNDWEKQIVAFAKSREAFKYQPPSAAPTSTPTPKVNEAPIVKDDRIGNKNITEVATYIPHRNIKSIVVEFNGKEVTLNGSDIFDGIYVENKYLGIKTRKKREPKVARTQFEEETFEFAKGGYTRPAYDLKTTDDYYFVTNSRVEYEFSVAGFEREGDDTDSLYFDDLDTTAKRDLGTIIIKNNAWKKLASGQTIKAISSTGISGKLTKVIDKKSDGGNMSSWKHKQKNSNK